MLRSLRCALVLPFVFSLCHAANPGGVPLSSLTFNGWAGLLSDGYVRLTHNSSQASSAFVPTPFTLGQNDSFAAEFVYRSQQEIGQCIADGLAFVVQNSPAGPNYLGSDGSGLGFFTGTVSPAIGLTFDYYENAITGTPPNAAAIASPDGTDLVWTSPNPPALSGPDAVRYVRVIYHNSSKIMRVYYSATPKPPTTPLLEMVLPTDLSSLLGGQAYFGVTAGTGSCYSAQVLLYLGLNVVNQQ
ncbi:MAG TPA: L-type lectin-domain containing protein [Bryobacteraceae bacterium]|nr:L-type lectin-domain containing protein [Bryobacteraceae bacterium]